MEELQRLLCETGRFGDEYYHELFKQIMIALLAPTKKMP
jgi:hypothetical protein